MERKKNCVILHGCEFDEQHAEILSRRARDNHWTAWVRDELIARGIATVTPTLPRSWMPSYEAFREELEKYVITENTILVGHSCSCAFLVRWLGETKQKIAQLVLVAPWKIYDPHDAIRADFYTYEIDPKITKRVRKIVMYTADNESDDGKKSLQIFHDALGGRIILLIGRGHYRTREWATSAFSELVDEIDGGV